MESGKVERMQNLSLPWEVEMLFPGNPQLKENQFKTIQNVTWDSKT